MNKTIVQQSYYINIYELNVFIFYLIITFNYHNIMFCSKMLLKLAFNKSILNGEKSTR